MASNALIPIVYQLQQGLRSFDLMSMIDRFDLQKFVNSIDLKTVGWIAVIVVAVIFLLDLLAKPFGPFGRSLAVTAANTWDKRLQNGFAGTGHGRNSQNLETVTEVLDSVAEGVMKWESTDDNTMRNRAGMIHFS